VLVQPLVQQVLVLPQRELLLPSPEQVLLQLGPVRLQLALRQLEQELRQLELVLPLAAVEQLLAFQRLLAPTLALLRQPVLLVQQVVQRVLPREQHRMAMWLARQSQVQWLQVRWQKVSSQERWHRRLIRSIPRLRVLGCKRFPQELHRKRLGGKSVCRVPMGPPSRGLRRSKREPCSHFDGGGGPSSVRQKQD
jgi:hypothetical protein